MALNGRRKQKRRAITKVIPIEVPKDARKAVSCICFSLASSQFIYLLQRNDYHIPAPGDVYKYMTRFLGANGARADISLPNKSPFINLVAI